MNEPVKPSQPLTIKGDGYFETVAGDNCIIVRPKWISVKDKTQIPLEDERILLTDGEIVFEGLIGWFDNGEPIWCNTEYMDHLNDQITHWMPLPQPPKGA